MTGKDAAVTVLAKMGVFDFCGLNVVTFCLCSDMIVERSCECIRPLPECQELLFCFSCLMFPDFLSLVYMYIWGRGLGWRGVILFC